MKKVLKFLVIITFSILTLTILFVGTTVASATLYEEKLTNKNRDISVFDLNNNEISGSSDYYVEYNDLPKNLINAFIAIEDKRFYSHNGLDYMRIGGATINNFKSMSLSEGASTITCQLIKNTHLSSDKTLTRKIKEAKLALSAEKKYTKEEIITMYLNVIYFGNSIYGANRASRAFFDKNVTDLSLNECATLAAVVVNPSKYSPIINYNANKTRRNTVLSLMLEQGYIDNETYNNAYDKDITIVGNTKEHSSQSYKQNAIYEATKLLNTDNINLRDSEVKIYTYYDNHSQQTLYDALNNDNLLIENSNGATPDTAGMLVDNKNAGISAYYSTTAYMSDRFRRQPGSIIKPISVYGAALEKGVILPATPIYDSPEDFEGYSPKNYNDIYYGWTDARTALSKSMNVSAVKVMTYTTLPYAVNFSERLGLQLNDDDKNLALALGGLTNGLTQREICGAYMTYANGGRYSKPVFVKKITDKYGKILYQHSTEKTTVTNENVAYMITDMLKDTAKLGTAKKLSALNFDVAAKTGTVASSGGNSDAWCALYNTQNTLCVWQGNVSMEREKMLKNNITGGSYPTAMARQIMSNLYSYKPLNFVMPETIKKTAFDKYSLNTDHSLLLANEYTPDQLIHYDLAPTENTIAVSDYFSMPKIDKFEVVNNGNNVTLVFDALPFYTYKIIRRQDFEETVIETVQNRDGEIYITDIPEEGIAIYKIIPYFEQNGNIVSGQESAVKGILYTPPFISTAA